MHARFAGVAGEEVGEVGGVEGLAAAAGGRGDRVHRRPAARRPRGPRCGERRGRPWPAGAVPASSMARSRRLGQLLVVDRELEQVDGAGAHDVAEAGVGPAAEGQHELMAGSSSRMTARRASPERVPRLGPATSTSKGPSESSTSPTDPTRVTVWSSGRGRRSSTTRSSCSPALRSEGLGDFSGSSTISARPELHTVTRVGAVGDLLDSEGPFDVLIAARVATRSGLARLEVIHDELPAMQLLLALLRRPGRCPSRHRPHWRPRPRAAARRQRSPEGEPGPGPQEAPRARLRPCRPPPAAAGRRSRPSTRSPPTSFPTTPGSKPASSTSTCSSVMSTGLRLRPSRSTTRSSVRTRRDGSAGARRGVHGRPRVGHLCAGGAEGSGRGRSPSTRPTSISAVRTRFDYVVVDTPLACSSPQRRARSVDAERDSGLRHRSRQSPRACPQAHAGLLTLLNTPEANGGSPNDN